MNTAQLPVKRIADDRVATHYVGPCAHELCTKPATKRVTMRVAGCYALTWVCDDHRRLLP